MWNPPWHSRSLGASANVPRAYHATSYYALDFIRKQGLKPQYNEGLIDRGIKHQPMIYFELGSDNDEPNLEDWGDVVLRFPVPDDMQDGEMLYDTQGQVTFKRVPSKLIEVKNENGEWEPLISKKAKR